MNHVSCIVNPASILEAKAVGYKAFKSLSSYKKAARVHSVFDRGFYIQIGKNLISVIKNENFISPTSIVLGDSDDRGFRSIGVEEGTKIEVDGDSLVFEDKALTITFRKSVKWFPPPIPKKNALSDLIKISLHLRILRDVIYTCPSREGLVSLLENVELYGPTQLFLKPQRPNLSEKARPNIETLMWGLFSGDHNMVLARASEILGLGPGLTPSGDDFLAGLILSLAIGGKALRSNNKSELGFYRKISADIDKMAGEKTTIYSQTLLNQARSGQGPKAVVELIHALLTKDPNQVARSAKTVISMGETSGADIAIGIYYGIRFLISRLERLEDILELE
jgi:hypothetical protein